MYAKTPQTRAKKTAVKGTAVLLPIILLVVAILMFTGNVEVKCEEETFAINATYWTDLEIAYSEIDTVTYRTDWDAGVRTNGFGSPKLAMGIFQNDECGSYTLYSYTGAKAYVLLTSGERTLAIGMSDVNETQEIYRVLTEKVKK